MAAAHIVPPLRLPEPAMDEAPETATPCASPPSQESYPRAMRLQLTEGGLGVGGSRAAARDTKGPAYVLSSSRGHASLKLGHHHAACSPKRPCVFDLKHGSQTERSYFPHRPAARTARVKTGVASRRALGPRVSDNTELMGAGRASARADGGGRRRESSRAEAAIAFSLPSRADAYETTLQSFNQTVVPSVPSRGTLRDKHRFVEADPLVQAAAAQPRVLRFFGIIMEQRQHTLTECEYHTRHVTVYYFMEDGTVEVVEKREDNNGGYGGVIVKRSEVLISDPCPLGTSDQKDRRQKRPLRVTDLAVGRELVLNGYKVLLHDADSSTRRDHPERAGQMTLEVPSASVGLAIGSPTKHVPRNPSQHNNGGGHVGNGKGSFGGGEGGGGEVEGGDSCFLMAAGADGCPSISSLNSGWGGGGGQQQPSVDSLYSSFSGGHRGGYRVSLSSSRKEALQYYAHWDDRDTEQGSLHLYTLQYFLTDGSLEMRELVDTRGGNHFTTPCPIVLKRQVVPKEDVVQTCVDSIGASIEGSNNNNNTSPACLASSSSLAAAGAPRGGKSHSRGGRGWGGAGREGSAEALQLMDFRVGQTVRIGGKTLTICGANESTYQWWAEVVGLDMRRQGQGDLAAFIERAQHNKTVPRPAKHPVDSLLHPKRPGNLLGRFLQASENQGIVFRFKAILTSGSTSYSSAGTEYVVCLYPSDDSLAVYVQHPRGSNSGVAAGTYLKRGRFTNKETGLPFVLDDFSVGSLLTMPAVELKILEADSFTYHYLGGRHPNWDAAEACHKLARSLDALLPPGFALKDLLLSSETTTTQKPSDTTGKAEEEEAGEEDGPAAEPALTWEELSARLSVVTAPTPAQASSAPVPSPSRLAAGRRRASGVAGLEGMGRELLTPHEEALVVFLLTEAQMQQDQQDERQRKNQPHQPKPMDKNPLLRKRTDTRGADQQQRRRMPLGVSTLLAALTLTPSTGELGIGSEASGGFPSRGRESGSLAKLAGAATEGRVQQELLSQAVKSAQRIPLSGLANTMLTKTLRKLHNVLFLARDNALLAAAMKTRNLSESDVICKDLLTDVLLTLDIRQRETELLLEKFGAAGGGGESDGDGSGGYCTYGMLFAKLRSFHSALSRGALVGQENPPGDSAASPRC